VKELCEPSLAKQRVVVEIAFAGTIPSGVLLSTAVLQAERGISRGHTAGRINEGHETRHKGY